MKINNNKGFTIIELLVAMAAFATVMTLILSVYLNMNNVFRRARATQAVSDNLSAVMEVISLDVKMGKFYDTTIANRLSLTVRQPSEKTVIYQLNDSGDIGFIERKDGSDSFKALTSDDVNITNLEFFKIDDNQDLITVIINGHSNDKEQVKFDLQTSITGWRLSS